MKWCWSAGKKSMSSERCRFSERTLRNSIASVKLRLDDSDISQNGRGELDHLEHDASVLELLARMVAAAEDAADRLEARGLDEGDLARAKADMRRTRVALLEVGTMLGLAGDTQMDVAPDRYAEPGSAARLAWLRGRHDALGVGHPQPGRDTTSAA
jgi:hypothetical protein